MFHFIRGTCEELCPIQEIKFRTKQRLLSFYELKSGEKYAPDMVIKEFKRSAAGTKTPKSSELRTVRALKKTIDYLFTEVLLDKRKAFNFVYDFIFDRLRCVRQEIVIQNFDNITTITLLGPIILFLAYSSYKLCAEPIENFDLKICNQHLQECLKRILCCYDELDRQNLKQNFSEKQNRRFIEALYQVFNLGTTESLERALAVPKKIQDPVFLIAKKISLEYFKGNYYQVVRGIKQLPHILCAIAFMKIPNIRRKLLQCFAHAYNSQQFVVPISWLKDLLLYSNLQDLINDCKHYNIQVTDDKTSVRFSKIDFSVVKPIVQYKKELFVDDKLSQIFLPDILLLRQKLY